MRTVTATEASRSFAAILDVATNRAVLTTDRSAHFADLPGVDCLIV